MMQIEATDFSLRADVSVRDTRKMVVASAAGTALEFFDFGLYSLASALIFNHLFFPSISPNLARVFSFAIFSVGFAIRPLGGILFGSLGDRIGRKRVLVYVVMLMGASTTGIGLLPTYDVAGIWAPILLIVMRVMQGLGAGAEAAGASTVIAEYAPDKKRGLYASMPYLGVAVGTLMSAVVFFILLQIPRETLYAGAWRVPFIGSIVLIGIAFYIRLRFKESPTFNKLKARKQIAESPIKILLKTSRRTVGIGILMGIAQNGGSSLYKTLAISYVSTIALDGSQWAASIGSVSLVSVSILGMATVPFAGWLSDHLGRRLTYRLFLWFMILFAGPSWWMMSTGNTFAILSSITIATAVGVWGLLGVQGAMLPELFGSSHRYTGVAVSREVAAVISGGVAPALGAILLSVYDNAWWPLSVYTALMAAVTLAGTYFMPETVARNLDDTADAH